MKPDYEIIISVNEDLKIHKEEVSVLGHGEKTLVNYVLNNEIIYTQTFIDFDLSTVFKHIHMFINNRFKVKH